MAITIEPTGTRVYGARQYYLYLDGNPVALLTKAQHPGNAFEDARRFWTLTEIISGAVGERVLRVATRGMERTDWPTLREATAEILEHFEDGE